MFVNRGHSAKAPNKQPTAKRIVASLVPAATPVKNATATVNMAQIHDTLRWCASRAAFSADSLSKSWLGLNAKPAN